METSNLISHWEAVRAGLLETIGKFREEELDYKPFPDFHLHQPSISTMAHHLTPVPRRPSNSISS